MRCIWLFGSFVLALTACGTSAAPAAPVASTSGGEEPSLVCPNRTRDEDLQVVALEMGVLRLARKVMRDSPSDTDAPTIFVATISRILGYQDHDSACTGAEMLEEYSAGCVGGPRTPHDELLPSLARRADELCAGEPRAARTLASLHVCGLAD